MSKDQIFGFVVIGGVGVYIYGSAIFAKMKGK